MHAGQQYYIIMLYIKPKIFCVEQECVSEKSPLFPEDKSLTQTNKNNHVYGYILNNCTSAASTRKSQSLPRQNTTLNFTNLRKIMSYENVSELSLLCITHGPTALELITLN